MTDGLDEIRRQTSRISDEMVKRLLVLTCNVPTHLHLPVEMGVISILSGGPVATMAQINSVATGTEIPTTTDPDEVEAGAVVLIACALSLIKSSDGSSAALRLFRAREILELEIGRPSRSTILNNFLGVLSKFGEKTR